MQVLRKLVCGLIALIGVTVAVMVIGLRTKCTLVLTAVRRMNHVFWNPRAMQTAGAPGAYASVIRHVGCTTRRLQRSRPLLDHPQMVPSESVASYFSTQDQRAHRWFGVDECLRVRTVTSAD